MKYLFLMMVAVMVAGCSSSRDDDRITAVDMVSYATFRHDCVFNTPDFEARVMSTDRNSNLDELVSACRSSAIDHAIIYTNHAEFKQHPNWIEKCTQGWRGCPL